MVNEERCPTRLLIDRPAETDEFGGHNRVAHSIVEVLQTESGGRSIGLEGGWGAGKSTIVKLTSNKLRQTKDCDYRVIEFDIWAHQDDPLRRTFLEKIITACIHEFKWVNKNKWERNLAELSKRRREDTTRIVPALTRTGIFFALILLLSIPVGSSLISAGVTLLTSTSGSGQLKYWLLGAGTVALLLTVICYLLMLVFLLIKKSVFKRGEQDDGLSELPALVTGQASSESRTIVTQTPDPTSVEFEMIFRNLLSEALKPESRKLLLVIDNLDRVQPSDALSVWSTLQTFLGHSDYDRPEWLERLWVLIPFDGDAILRLWEAPNSDSPRVTKRDPAKSFLDKTFQLRFEVPPLLILNWRNFLNQALQEALPNHEVEDFYDVYRAYAVEGGFESSAPTPRDLKIFVNQIGALHRERQDEFPLSSLACYALLQRGDKDVREVLLSEEDSELPSRIIGEHWREVIAALHFGVPTLEANQLLLRGPIETALANGDANSFSDLASIHTDAFWAVLEDSVPAGTRGWNTLTAFELATAATVLAESRVLDYAEKRQEASAVLSNIRSAVEVVPHWSPFDDTTARGMINVGRLVGGSEGILPALLAGASNLSVGNMGGITPNEWMASSLTLFGGLAKLGFDKQMRKGINVRLSAQQWLDVSPEAAQKDPDGQILQYFELQSIAEIDELVATQISSGLEDETTFISAQTAMATKSRYKMTNVANAVLSSLQTGEEFRGDRLASMLRILRYLKRENLITSDQYDEFATNGYYLHHLYYAYLDRHSEAVGEALFGYLQVVPDAQEPTHFGESNSGYAYLNELFQTPDSVPGAVECFAVLAEETQQLSAVLKMANGKRPVPPFLAKVLNTLLTSGDVPKPFELVRKNWRVIREALGKGEEYSQSFETFLQGLPDIDNLVTAVVGDTFNVLDSGLYIALLKGRDTTNLVTWYADRLSYVDQGTWSEELESQGELVELAVELKAIGADVALGAAYSDALMQYAESAASSPEEGIPNDTWRELFAMLNADQRELLPSRAYGILEDINSEASAKFFSIFGDMLSDQNLLANERRLIVKVCTPLLDGNNEAGIAWIAKIAESAPSLLTENVDRAAANDFKDRVLQHLNGAQEDAPTFQHLETIASVFGIEPEDRVAESTDEGS